MTNWSRRTRTKPDIGIPRCHFPIAGQTPAQPWLAGAGIRLQRLQTCGPHQFSSCLAIKAKRLSGRSYKLLADSSNLDGWDLRTSIERGYLPGNLSREDHPHRHAQLRGSRRPLRPGIGHAEGADRGNGTRALRLR
jgi:hypothetical protein